MGVELLSAVDPQIIQNNAGKQFSTSKSKKSKDYSKAIWTFIYLLWVRTALVPKLKVW